MAARIARTRPVVHRAVSADDVRPLCGATLPVGPLSFLAPVDAMTNCPACWDVIAAGRVAARNDAA